MDLFISTISRILGALLFFFLFLGTLFGLSTPFLAKDERNKGIIWLVLLLIPAWGIGQFWLHIPFFRWLGYFFLFYAILGIIVGLTAPVRDERGWLILMLIPAWGIGQFWLHTPFSQWLNWAKAHLSIQVVVLSAGMIGSLLIRKIILCLSIDLFDPRTWQTTSVMCGACHRVVSLSSKSGQRCPHCGVYWHYEDRHYEDKTGYNPDKVQRNTANILAILVFILSIFLMVRYF